MPLKRLRTLDSRLIHSNPYWEYRLDKYTLPDGSAGDYFYMHSSGSVVVVPVTSRGKLVLVKQFRYLWKKESIEFPSGGVKGRSYSAAARNELAEEAQLAASGLRLVGTFDPCNGATDEKCRVYLATGLSRREREKDPSEEFEIMELTPAEFERMISDGKIWDGMTLAAWTIAGGLVARSSRRRGK